MIERIQQLMAHKNLNATNFAETIGVQRSAVSHVLSGRNKASLDFILKIKNHFTELNLDWILLGEGDMFLSAVSNKISEFDEITDNTADTFQSAIHFEKSQLDTKTEDDDVKSTGRGLNDEFGDSQGRNNLSGIMDVDQSKDTQSAGSLGNPSQIILVYPDNRFKILSNK